MARYLILLALICPAVLAQTPTFDAATRVLKLPNVEVIENGTSSFVSVEFIATPDLSSFVPVDVTKPAPEVVLSDVSGSFEGTMARYMPGATRISSFQACPSFSFNPATTTVVVAISGSQIAMSHDAFGGTKCNYTGTINGTDVGGTFQCNDFNQGTWKANILKLPTSIGDSLTAHIGHAGEKCSFDTSFTGIRK
ncbi:MAG: hypothetical protein Q8N34_03145 [Gammaproteobacteria bacterium]|nr:hypothetical protein [Gammaproteobacteria bacterium]